jgi:cytidylate kinase
MKRKDVISITGDLASGQSTVSKMLAEDLGFFLYRNGTYFRELAIKSGMSVTEFGFYVKDHPEIDIEIERSATEYAKNNENIVIDAKLGWYAVPESFKVYLKVDVDVAAKRAFADPHRKRSEDLPTLEEQKADMIKRTKSDLQRYLDLYKVRRDDMNNYDLVIDTTNLRPEEVLEIIKQEYQKWKEC